MKKEIVIMMAAAAVLAGCQERTDTTVTEPAGADRPMRTNELSTNWLNDSTNTIQEPSGAARESQQDSSSSGTGSQQQDSSSQTTNSQPQSGATP